MNLDKIAAVIAACERANEAILDAIEAANDAGLPVDQSDGLRDVIAVEHAAKTARNAARRSAALGISTQRPALPRMNSH